MANFQKMYFSVFTQIIFISIENTRRNEFFQVILLAKFCKLINFQKCISPHLHKYSKKRCKYKKQTQKMHFLETRIFYHISHIHFNVSFPNPKKRHTSLLSKPSKYIIAKRRRSLSLPSFSFLR